MKRFPTISIVIATYNSERTIALCLKSVRNQKYPQKKIHIIVADGGSQDNTKSIAKRFRVRWIDIPPSLQNAEYNKSLGVRQATGEILFLLDHDNVLPHNMWMRSMIEPFLCHNDIVGVETLRYHYDPSFSLLDRYFALFGAGDPLAFYVGKADRLSFLYDTYNLYGKARDVRHYYIVDFDDQHIPTLGANGFFVWRDILLKHAQVTPETFFHIDINVDLIRKGFRRYAFVKDSIIHLTGYGNIVNFLRRRMLFVEQYHLGEQGVLVKHVRRYSVFEKKDVLRLLYFIIISLTFVVPLYDSLRGYRKVRDAAWFLHPFLCFSLVVLYSWVIIEHHVKIYAKKFLAE